MPHAKRLNALTTPPNTYTPAKPNLINLLVDTTATTPQNKNKILKGKGKWVVLRDKIKKTRKPN